MAYATIQDITDAYGPDALYAADRDGDGVAEEATVIRALDAATAEIDSFLAPRYALPRSEPQPILRQLAVDIALYRMASTADVMTEERRRRFDDAMKTLQRLGRGEQSLPVPASDLDGDGSEDGPQPVVLSGPERLFSRKSLRDY